MLLYAAIIFACVVGWIFSADYFALLPLRAYDWTFIYLYAAVFFQIFINPALGIVGACRLSRHLLWAYWGSMGKSTALPPSNKKSPRHLW